MCRDFIPDGHGLSASYTVEASYVMAVVILSLALLIRTAYGRYLEAVGIMRLHHIVEFMRGQEKSEQRDFSVTDGTGNVVRKKDKVLGNVSGGTWKKEISAGVHRPEDWMRMLTIFDKMAEGEKNNDGTRGAGNPVPEGSPAE